MAKRKVHRIRELKNVTHPRGSTGLNTRERFWLLPPPDANGQRVSMTATTLAAAKKKKELFEDFEGPLRIVDTKPDFSLRAGRRR